MELRKEEIFLVILLFVKFCIDGLFIMWLFFRRWFFDFGEEFEKVEIFGVWSFCFGVVKELILDIIEFILLNCWVDNEWVLFLLVFWGEFGEGFFMKVWNDFGFWGIGGGRFFFEEDRFLIIFLLLLGCLLICCWVLLICCKLVWNFFFKVIVFCLEVVRFFFWNIFSFFLWFCIFVLIRFVNFLWVSLVILIFCWLVLFWLDEVIFEWNLDLFGTGFIFLLIIVFGSLLGNLLVLLILLVLDMFDCFRALFRWNILFLLFDKEFWGSISKVLLIFDIFEFLWMSYLLKFDGRRDIFLLLILTLLNLLFCLLKLYFLCLEWLEFIFRIFRLDFFGYE